MQETIGLPMWILIAQAVDDASKARLQGTMLLGLVLAIGLIGLLVVVGLLYAWRKSVSRAKRKPEPSGPAADAWAVAGQRFEGDAEAGEHGAEAGGEDAPDPLAQRGEWLAGDPSADDSSTDKDPTAGASDQGGELDTGLDVDAGPKTYDTGIHFDDGYKDDTGPDTGENWKADTEYEEEEDEDFIDEDDEIDQAIAESQAMNDDDPFTAYREPADELKDLFEDEDEDAPVNDEDESEDEDRV